jgi:hypothetical protein
MTGKYDDIIHMEHPISKNHPQMPMINRAAQFAPFAALTGYEEALAETRKKMKKIIKKSEKYLLFSF